MKKVRLFAVAAAMGMFASTVAAAETTTGYVATWGEVDEIVKVDVGDVVVSPVATIKVVKETRTTDTDYNVTSDALGFDTDANCWTSAGVAEDENGDDYSDSQVYFNKVTADDGRVIYERGYFYSSRTEALTDYLVRTLQVLAPNTEAKEEVFYSPVLGQYFDGLEAIYDFLEEKGLVETVYNEDGDFVAVYVNAKTITDKKGNELAKARIEIPAVEVRKPELKTKEAVAAYLTGFVSEDLEEISPVEKVLYNYVEEKSNPLPFAYYEEDATEATPIALGSVIIVEESKYGLEIVSVVEPAEGQTHVTNLAGYVYSGWTNINGGNAVVKGAEGKITVVELVDDGEVSKLATVSPTKVGRYTPESTMVWDEEAGSFVKETNDYGTEFRNDEEYKGYWDTYVYEYDEEEETETEALRFTSDLLAVTDAYGINEYYEETIANPTDKWLLLTSEGITSVNSKDGKMTLANTAGKDITVNAVEIEVGDTDTLVPAFDSLETLVKVASKLEAYSKIGIVFGDEDVVDGIRNSGAEAFGSYVNWYRETETLANNQWSGFEDVATPKSELRGTGSEACSYVVSVESETVDAAVTASAVDTSVAGVKTMTLTASVDGKAVATKDVKVVVAPKYERTYVNGKVSVLKAFHLNGNLYAEYHYDWAAKTYSATFYQQDGVTVGSTANGTL